MYRKVNERNNPSCSRFTSDLWQRPRQRCRHKLLESVSPYAIRRNVENTAAEREINLPRHRTCPLYAPRGPSARRVATAEIVDRELPLQILDFGVGCPRRLGTL